MSCGKARLLQAREAEVQQRHLLRQMHRPTACPSCSVVCHRHVVPWKDTVTVGA